MTTLVDFKPTAIRPFQFTATFDAALYDVLITWNLSGQRWFMNIHDQSQNLVVCRSVVGSPIARNLEPPPSAERVASMTWSSFQGGRVYFVMEQPSLTVHLGSLITIAGARNSGAGGGGAVNGTFLVDQFVSPTSFSALLTASSGVIGTITGNIVILSDAHSLVWRRGLVVATTETPHGYRLGTVMRLAIDNVVPGAYNGTYYCAITGPREFRFKLTIDPGGPSTRSGSYSPDINLVDGYFSASSLIYRQASQQFEVRP